MENQEKCKIAIACGKTGGHIYPGIVIAQGLDLPNIEPFFITNKGGLSEKLIKEQGFKIFTIPISYWKRKFFSLNTLKVICSNLFSLFLSFFILLKEKPKVIVGMGGYPSFPPVLASLFLGIKRIIHEQNAKMGLANKLLSKIATKIAISYENTEFAPKRAIFTGCPIRTEIGKVSRKDGLSFFSLEDKKTILVMGGSSGSTKINSIVWEAMPYLSKFQLVWITGEREYQEIECKMQNAKCKMQKVLLFPFIYKMEYAYAAADIVIGRAGAVSIAEIKKCGIPAILIPYPYAKDNHQLKNASALEDAIVITENRLTKEVLQDAIEKINDKEKSPIDVNAQEKIRELIIEDLYSKNAVSCPL